jgi:hypothetical protein
MKMAKNIESSIWIFKEKVPDNKFIFIPPHWVVISSHVRMSCLSCICLCSYHNRHTKFYFFAGALYMFNRYSKCRVSNHCYTVCV